MITVLIAHHHTSFRAALRSILQAESDFNVVGEAVDGNAALKLALELAPDVVLADICMPGPGSAELVASLRELLPLTGFVVVGDREDPNFIAQTLQAGANAYINKLWIDAGLARVIRDAVICEKQIQASFGASQRPEMAPRAAPCFQA